MLLQRTSDVIFEEKEHRYFDKTGKEMMSVSKRLSQIQKPFESDMISMMMAKRDNPQATAAYLHSAAKNIRDGWKKIADHASGHGTIIHDNIESFFRYTTINNQEITSVYGGDKAIAVDQFKVMLGKFHKEFSDYDVLVNELMVHSPLYETAGQIDIALQRRKRSNVIDIRDFKTNIRKGINMDSIKRNADGWVKVNNQFMLPPVAHLESCNYNVYALQMSIYAFILELAGFTIGSLMLYYINPMFKVKKIPVNYLRHDAKAILTHCVNLKQLPA